MCVTSLVDKARIQFAAHVDANGGDGAVAEVLGCSRSYVCLIRTGQRTPQRLGFVARIERVTGIPREYWEQPRKPRRARAARRKKRKSQSSR